MHHVFCVWFSCFQTIGELPAGGNQLLTQIAKGSTSQRRDSKFRANREGKGSRELRLAYRLALFAT
jgi:hypothetical protein